jgi:hypothetical protein
MFSFMRFNACLAAICMICALSSPSPALSYDNRIKEIIEVGCSTAVVPKHSYANAMRQLYQLSANAAGGDARDATNNTISKELEGSVVCLLT